MILMMKVTNIYKHDIVDTVAYFQSNGGPGFSGIRPMVRNWPLPNFAVVTLGPNGGAVTYNNNNNAMCTIVFSNVFPSEWIIKNVCNCGC